MTDYYTTLIRIIRETGNDRAKLRGVVYEAARLSLRRQLNLQRPPLSFGETKRQLDELEEAIARVEASIAGIDLHVGSEPDEAETGLENGTHSGYSPRESGYDDASSLVEELRPWDTPSAEQAAPVESRELILVPDRVKRSTYLVNPADFVNADVTYRLPPAPRTRARMVASGIRAAFQLAVASVAIAAFYVAMWGRNSLVQTPEEMPAVAAQISNGRAATQPERTTGGTMPLPTNPPTNTLPFPRPTVYGVYAIHDNQLTEVEQIQAAPVDPRTRGQLQITQPGRVRIAAAKLEFVVYRRDLVSNAPDKVQVRIAARIAHSMIFDSNGKPVVTTPATDTWLIRTDQGYDLRVSPLRESAEMVILRPENPEFLFPSGRYELMLGGLPYDFVVAGEVTDPAHCVEGVATGRGPVFYQCKSE